MLHHVTANDFADWRAQARDLLQQDILPAHVIWQDSQTAQRMLGFNLAATPAARTKITIQPLIIPKEFLSLAQSVACHRDASRWDALYQAVWRLTHGEKHLLKLTTDPLVRNLQLMEKNVRRDAHKMKAFVRFRLVQDNYGDHYIAWHQPDHRVVRLTAPFFQRRFTVMRWTIMTPDETAMWDGKELTYGPGVPSSEAPQEDIWEEMWRTFYASIFNPARIKIDMMKREMPVRYWHTMPETQLIPQLLKDAPERVEKMIAHQEGLRRSAADFLPDDRNDYDALKSAAKECRGCPLYLGATQTVFGIGNLQASLMIVGEQPGKEEDRSGVPFVGPAGRVLNEALAMHGIDRDALYLTNAVKHYKNKKVVNAKGDADTEHVTANRGECNACKPWLDAEIRLVRPKIILCLGVTAARALLGQGFTMKNQRGVWFVPQNSGEGAPRVLVTWHPAALLRADQAYKARLELEFAQDVLTAWQAAQDI